MTAPGGSNGKRVVVLGGGVAGLSAARSLIERGFSVSLVEKRPFLGGRAYSFHSRDTGAEVDNGQHVFMGCCTYYIDFIRALGAYGDAVLQNSLRAEVMLDGKRGALTSAPILGPLHLIPSFIRYPHLGIWDKVRAAYGLLSAGLTDRQKYAKALDSQVFYDWLKRHHQSERAIENFWNLIILPTLNDDVRSVNADMALMVIKQGLLKRPVDAAIGYSRVGLTSLAGIPGRRFIEERGGSVILGKTIRSLLFDGDRVCGVQLSDGSTLEADAYVSALPFGTLLDCLPPEWTADPFFAPAACLTSAPIVGVHLWYDRQIMEDAFVAFLESPDPVGIQSQPYPGRRRLIRPIRLHISQRRVGFHRQAQGRASRTVYPGDAPPVPFRPRRGGRKVSGHQAAPCHLSVCAGSRLTPPLSGYAHS